MNIPDKIGIVDTGSNTILGVVFRWDERRKSYRCFSLSDGLTVHAGLLRYVSDGKLSKEGLSVLSDSLKKIRAFFERMGVSEKLVYCFATASLRGVKNFPEAKEQAAEEGFSMALLSGEEEARCDLAGMLQELSFLEQDQDSSIRFPEAGIAADMGGGSGQILCFSDRKKDCKNPVSDGFGSFPIGCLALKKRFVSASRTADGTADETAPSDRELESVRAFVQHEIETIPMIASLDPKSEIPPAFFAMGGTVKAIVRLLEKTGKPVSSPDQPGRTFFSVETLTQAIAFFRTPAGKALIETNEPGRKETLVIGAVSLLAIARRIGAGEITVLQSGVREGFVVRHCNPNV